MAGKRRPNEVAVVCEFCDAAGVIRENDYSKIAIICAGCGGAGFRTMDLRPFTKRRTLDGIKEVRWSGAGLTPFSSKPRKVKTISYAEFLKGKLP